MMSAPPFVLKARLGRSRQSGTALIIVLASLALILVIVLPFLLLSRTQLSIAKSSAREDAVKQLADRCVNTIIAQLTDATTGGTHISWASQPGAIRTYDDTGAPVMAYKLFSSDNMRVTGAYNPTQDTLDASLAGWSAKPGLYTDLNDPITVNGVNAYTSYPIVDPTAFSTDPTKNPVEGFSYTGAPAETSNPLPMPVQWLYVLQDGTLSVPTAGTSSGDSAIVVTATAKNPIVGRIAFWTDDETSKVNINTSSEGTFWDTPRSEGTTERDYGRFQPATKEFQRYPGHPAMTSLSGIFSGLVNGSGSTYPELLYPLIPHLSAGGSKEGNTIAATPLVPNPNRLYASIDEFMFKPSVVPRVQNNPLIDNTSLQKAKFFITANSRAPEVNLFNKPRITIWPINADLTTNPNSPFTTVTDRLIAFCSTMRNDLSVPYRYYFQRKDPDSQATDIGILRNQQLYQYLHNLTKLPVPGFGGATGSCILDKYGNDQDQILTEIFDYIRTANLQDGNLPAKNMYAPQRPVPVGIDMSQFPAFSSYPIGQGLVLPSNFVSNGTNTRGFGRFPTVSKVGLMFIVAADHSTDASILANQVKVQAVMIFDMFDPSLGWAGIFGGYTLRVSGLTGFQWGTDSSHQSSMGFNDGDLDIVQNSGDTINGSDYGGRMGFRYPLFGRGVPSVAPAIPFESSVLLLPNGTFSFSGGDIKIEVRYNNRNTVVQTLNISFPQGTFPVPTTPPVIAGANFYDFPSRFINNNTALGLTDGWSVIRPGDVVETVQCASGDVRLIAGRQTVNATDLLYAKHPDYGSSEPDAHSLYGSGPYGYYGASQGKLVPNVTYTTVNRHSFYSSAVPDVPAPNGVFTGDGGNPPGSSGSIPGDWDNSIANAPDGPYINKVDEGNVQGLMNGKVPYFDQSTVWAQAATTFFSANRQMPSPGMFGSLPTGVIANKPWQTLLFRPGPAGHPGASIPATGGPPYTTLPDYLLLDLFQMPVAEPYAISEPISTAGKVNMNYQIVPFTYITRETAIRAAMKKEMIMAIPSTGMEGTTYKTDANTSNYRHPIDMTETLKGFQQRFAANDIFRSASEICSIPLVPSGLGATYSGMSTFWNTYGLTGDNTQERPYTNIYQRLTTKSNTYTVHFRVQLLLKPKVRLTSAPTEFDESKGDTITAEYRGSSIVERYVDPNDQSLPDFADTVKNPDAVLDSYYHYHILSTKQFNP